MKQLATTDASFINLETNNCPQHVGSLGIYDPSTAEGGFVRFKDVINNFEQRLNNLPLFRTRLVQVPGGLDKPYWVVDANFDVEFHLRHIALPQPGDWRQLCIQIARLHSRPLDMSRPLWEAYIIEGLDNIEGLPKGSFAMYTKMHHSLVDGAGGQAYLASFHDLEPNPKPAEVDHAPIFAEHQPSPPELLTRAALNNLKDVAKLTVNGAGLAKNMLKFGLDIAQKKKTPPDISAPKTRFNEKVGVHRVFDSAIFTLEEFKAVKTGLGVTINDVALATVSGALRRYLTDKNQLPEDSLAAAIPLNMRTRKGENNDNNQVGSTFCDLHTNVEDPIERVGKLHESANKAKEFSEGSPFIDAIKIAGVLNPVITRPVVKFWQNNHLSKYLPVNLSTVVTNVPGPNFDIYCAGAKLVRLHGLGLLQPGCGLFHAVFSSGNSLTISFLGDRKQMPDPGFYAECLQASFEELKAAANVKS